jgi:hypothetical protein
MKRTKLILSVFSFPMMWVSLALWLILPVLLVFGYWWVASLVLFLLFLDSLWLKFRYYGAMALARLFKGTMDAMIEVQRKQQEIAMREAMKPPTNREDPGF